MAGHRDSYSSFAAHYDHHQWDWFARMYGPELLKALEKRGLKGGRHLDAGCGTGTLALMTVESGFSVVGVDLSEPMLEVARRKDARAAVSWRRGDVRSLDAGDLGGPFDLVTCVTDTLNHLETLDEWESAFRGFADHLRPGGFLYIDVLTCLGLRQLDKVNLEDVEKGVLFQTIIWEPEARRSTLKATSFLLSGENGLYQRATETIVEWGHPVEEILERVRKAGFVSLERLFTSMEDPETDPRLELLARRP